MAETHPNHVFAKRILKELVQVEYLYLYFNHGMTGSKTDRTNVMRMATMTMISTTISTTIIMTIDYADGFDHETLISTSGIAMTKDKNYDDIYDDIYR